VDAKNTSEDRTVISGQSEIAKGLGGLSSAAAINRVGPPPSSPPPSDSARPNLPPPPTRK
jgi:hypothetical protein